MILTDITRIVKTLLVAFATVSTPDAQTQRRIDEIGEVLGAADDVAADEGAVNASAVARRVKEAHDIIHRVAAILAMEEDDGGGGTVNAAPAASAGQIGDEPLAEVSWDGKLDGETFELADALEE